MTTTAILVMMMMMMLVILRSAIGDERGCRLGEK